MSTKTPYKLVVVIDDERIPNFDRSLGYDLALFRSANDGLEGLKWYHDEGEPIHQLWLDYSLGTGGDIFDTLMWLKEIAEDGKPLLVDEIKAHASSSGRLLIHEILSPFYPVSMQDLPSR